MKKHVLWVAFAAMTLLGFSESTYGASTVADPEGVELGVAADKDAGGAGKKRVAAMTAQEWQLLQEHSNVTTGEATGNCCTNWCSWFMCCFSRCGTCWKETAMVIRPAADRAFVIMGRVQDVSEDVGSGAMSVRAVLEQYNKEARFIAGFLRTLGIETDVVTILEDALDGTIAVTAVMSGNFLTAVKHGKRVNKDLVKDLTEPMKGTSIGSVLARLSDSMMPEDYRRGPGITLDQRHDEYFLELLAVFAQGVLKKDLKFSSKTTITVSGRSGAFTLRHRNPVIPGSGGKNAFDVLNTIAFAAKGEVTISDVAVGWVASQFSVPDDRKGRIA